MENLKALVYKVDLTAYQRVLAQIEFEGLIERIELYEKAVKNNAVLTLVSQQRELLINFMTMYDGDENSILHDDIIKIIDTYLEIN